MALLSPLLLALLASLPLIVHCTAARAPAACGRLEPGAWRRFARRTVGPRLRRLPLTLLLFSSRLAALLALALAQPQLTALAGPGTLRSSCSTRARAWARATSRPRALPAR
jgi:hypothetical protein